METIQFVVIVGGLIFGAAILNAAVKTQERSLDRIEGLVTTLLDRVSSNEIADAKRDGKMEAIQEMQTSIIQELRRAR